MMKSISDEFFMFQMSEKEEHFEVRKIANFQAISEQFQSFWRAEMERWIFHPPARGMQWKWKVFSMMLSLFAIPETTWHTDVKVKNNFFFFLRNSSRPALQ